MLLQKLWEGQHKWDDILPKDLEQDWNEMKNDLLQLSSVTVPRYIPAKKSKTIRLICFCDASIQAYATTVYVQFLVGDIWQANLVMAKSRVAPKRKFSIPRLELLAAMIGVRSMKFVENQLRLNISERVLWSDSKCVLYWIKSKKRLSVFVENRVKEIRAYEGLSMRYVKTTDNPADIATKPQTTKELKENCLWWGGPSWLSTDLPKWPDWDFKPITTEEAKRISEEERESKVFYEVGLEAGSGHLADGLFTIVKSRYSSWMKLLRVTAWVLRFLRRLSPGRYPELHRENSGATSKGHLSVDEIAEAKLLWERKLQNRFYNTSFDAKNLAKMKNLERQLGLKTDKDGLLRCYGRLSNATGDEGLKFPKLLPKNSHLTDLIIQHYHKALLHSGVSHTLGQLRTEYWIPQGRSAVRKIISRCVTCRKVDGGPFKTPPMPPLPGSRVNPSPPFSHTGADYFGPLYVKTSAGSSAKVWVCLFTCLCVRAVHLEVVNDMSGEEFLFALRFIARRGRPVQIISDNAPQFKVAGMTKRNKYSSVMKDVNLSSFLSSNGITWNFIPEFAPWMGGFYERLIGLVKKSLKKTVGRQHLSEQQLNTTLAEVESIVNSRPLVYIGGDLASSPLLTPGDFLCFNPRQSLPVFDTDITMAPNYNKNQNPAERVVQAWIKGQKLLQSFWDVWEKNYLLNLRERHQPNLKAPRVTSSLIPQIDQVVLIKDGQSPRGTWKPGRIVQLIPSSDGHFRSVKLQTPSRKTLVRPVRNLFPLELQNKDELFDALPRSTPNCDAGSQILNPNNPRQLSVSVDNDSTASPKPSPQVYAGVNRDNNRNQQQPVSTEVSAGIPTMGTNLSNKPTENPHVLQQQNQTSISTDRIVLPDPVEPYSREISTNVSEESNSRGITNRTSVRRRAFMDAVSKVQQLFDEDSDF